MHRRNLLLSCLALPLAASTAGCQWMKPPPLVIVCDPDLVTILERAAEAWPDRRGAPVQVFTDISPRELGLQMDGLLGGVVATREEKNVNRLQRTGKARLSDRWKRQTKEGQIELLVTRGDFQAEHESKLFARWLASPAADRFFTQTAERTRVPRGISI